MDTFEVMRSAYFTRGSNSLPELDRAVPRIEANFYMWLSCRKQQWRKHRSDKRARQKLTPEEDFPRQEENNNTFNNKNNIHNRSNCANNVNYDW